MCWTCCRGDVGKSCEMVVDKVGFVLGGGGQLGAHEVGTLRALLERGIVPDLVVGTSVGAINGPAVAAEPSLAAVGRLAATWSAIESGDFFAGPLLRRLGTLARAGAHLRGNDRLRALRYRATGGSAEDIERAYQAS